MDLVLSEHNALSVSKDNYENTVSENLTEIW